MKWHNTLTITKNEERSTNFYFECHGLQRLLETNREKVIPMWHVYLAASNGLTCRLNMTPRVLNVLFQTCGTLPGTEYNREIRKTMQ